MELGRLCVNERVFEPHRALEMRHSFIVILFRRGNIAGQNFLRDREHRVARVRRKQRLIERLVRH